MNRLFFLVCMIHSPQSINSKVGDLEPAKASREVFIYLDLDLFLLIYPQCFEKKNSDE